MSQNNYGANKGYKAGSDLSTKQWYLVKQTAVDTVDITSAGTDLVMGVIQNKPKSGEIADVLRVGGGATLKVKIGGTVSIGDRLKSDSSGRGVTTTTSGDVTFGIALQAGVSGDIIEVAGAREKI